MPTIQSLVTAQMQSTPGAESSSLSLDQLQQQLERLSRRLSLFEATERVTKIGHYEWSREHGWLESCSAEYASLFNMTIEEALASHSTLEKTLLLIHPEDREHYLRATDAMEVSNTLEVECRILLKDGSVKYIRESAVSTFDVDTGSFGLIQDITRQVRYERDLESRDELARGFTVTASTISWKTSKGSTTIFVMLSTKTANVSPRSIATILNTVRTAPSSIVFGVVMVRFAGYASWEEPRR